MAVKTIYLNPNDVLRVRIINDDTLPKNEREWRFQIHPQGYFFKVDERGELVGDPLINREMKISQNVEMTREMGASLSR